MMEAIELEAGLRAFLCDELGIPADEISRDGELFSSGQIDSADLVRLATWVERAVGLEIPDGDVTVDHFDSIAKVVAYVDAHTPVDANR